MITKLASSYYSGNDVFEVKNVKGFKSAVLRVILAEGDSIIVGPYITRDGSAPAAAASTERPDVYKDGIKQTGNLTISTVDNSAPLGIISLLS